MTITVMSPPTTVLPLMVTVTVALLVVIAPPVMTPTFVSLPLNGALISAGMGEAPIRGRKRLDLDLNLGVMKYRKRHYLSPCSCGALAPLRRSCA